MNGIFIFSMIFTSASSFATDSHWTFRQIIESSSVYVELDQGKVYRAVRLYIEDSAQPIVVVDFWKSGVIRRISETPLDDLKGDRLDLEDWQFPILKDHKLGADIRHSADRYPDAYIGFTNMTPVINSNGRMYCAVDNVTILGTSRRLQESMGLAGLNSVIENNDSFKDFVEGRYPKPSYFSKCELSLMR